ncbi:hypothetical protein BTHI11S_05984 [Bosea thiooxidans]
MLAMDPEVRPLPIVLAAPVESSDRVRSEARRLARSTACRCGWRWSKASKDACDAMEAGVHACRFQTVALLSGTAQIRMPRLARPARTYLSRPRQDNAWQTTLLFEDVDPRASAWLEGEGSETRRIAEYRFVGYPLEAVRKNLGPMEVAADRECCVLSRAAADKASRARTAAARGCKAASTVTHLRHRRTGFVFNSSLKLLKFFEKLDELPISRVDPAAIDRINAEYDYVFLRGSNYIHAQMNWSRAAEVLRLLKIPVIAFGVGAQAPVSGKLELSEDTRTVLKLIADFDHLARRARRLFGRGAERSRHPERAYHRLPDGVP